MGPRRKIYKQVHAVSTDKYNDLRHTQGPVVPGGLRKYTSHPRAAPHPRTARAGRAAASPPRPGEDPASKASRSPLRPRGASHPNKVWIRHAASPPARLIRRMSSWEMLARPPRHRRQSLSRHLSQGHGGCGQRHRQVPLVNESCCCHAQSSRFPDGILGGGRDASTHVHPVQPLRAPTRTTSGPLVRGPVRQHLRKTSAPLVVGVC